MMKGCKAQHVGYTLIEMLVYVVILATVVNICAGIFSSSMRLNDMGTATLDRMHRLDEVREEFAAAIHKSSAVVPAAWDYQTGEDRVVLETAQDTPDGARHFIVFGCLKSPSALTRLEFSGKDGSYTIDHMETYGADFASVAFEYNSAEPSSTRLVTLVSALEGEGSDHRPPLERRFAATLRGIGTGGAVQ
jgi:type II secretory pathway pseudopilin PulG